MGAICKTIEIHQDDLNPVLNYTKDLNKTTLDDVEQLLQYAANPEKTLFIPEDGDKSVLVSGVLCNPDTANQEFAVIRNKYRETHPEILAGNKRPVTAIHLIQSFEEENIDPRLVHEIGLELVDKLGVQAVVDTHVNKKHIHNHIVINAYIPNASQKICMNKDKRNEIRRMSDDIQREYGLHIRFNEPELQEKISQSRSMNYAEWEARHTGQSWKDAVRNDIAAARSVSGNFKEYIEVMQGYGYRIESTKGEESVCWRINDKKIWDSTLGQEYMPVNMFSGNLLHNMAVDNKVVKKEISQPHTIISVSRYNESGKRRSDLELLIRRAIAIVQSVIKYLDNIGSEGKTKRYKGTDKLIKLQEALNTMQEYGFNDIEEINTELNKIGKELNVIKHDVSDIKNEVEYYSYVKAAIKEYEDAKQIYDSVLTWNSSHDLHINNYSKDDIRKNKARIAPLTTNQRAELYNVMKKHPSLRLNNPGHNYENISRMDYKAIIDYTKGKGTMPDCLVDVTVTNYEHSYNEIYNNLTKMDYTPNAKQIKEAKQLLKENNLPVPDKLGYADIINILNCYGPMPELTKKADNEPAPSPNDVARLKTLLEDKGMAIPMEIDELNNKSARRLYNWLVSQDRLPVIIQQDINKNILNDFHADISTETLNKQQVLIQMRNAVNTLAMLGITPDDIPDIFNKIEESEKQYEEAKELKNEKADEYKTLFRLKQQTFYATNKPFLYDKILSKKEIEKIEKQLNEKIEYSKEEERIINNLDRSYQTQDKSLSR